jgi:subtilisin family serine protease
MTNATAGRIHRANTAGVLALLLVGTALAVPARGQTGPGDATETGHRITRADLLAAPIPSVCGMPPTHLVDGVHPDSDTFPDPGPAAAIFGHGVLTGAPEKVRKGDFTGDGVADGLIVVGCNQTSGSSYITSRVFAYASDGHFLGHVPVTGHVPPSWAPFEVGRTVIVDGTIRLQVRTFRPSDPHCCASVLTRLWFRWGNGAFHLVRRA